MAEAAGAQAEWGGYPYDRLARICEAGGLTEREARVLNLYCRGLSFRAMGEVLGIRRYRVIVWRHLHRAVEKLASVRERERGARREWFRFILECVRNVRQGEAPPTLACDENGRPVTLRARLVSVDDLAGRGEDLFEELARSLSGDEGVRG
jgi:DNA-binding CsgD family transcriptional regulator